MNATVECIPKAGIFMLSSESLNYTEARSFCQKRNASLAHVISEERTEGLAKFVSENLPRFVGLSSGENKERIWKNEFGNSRLQICCSKQDNFSNRMPKQKTEKWLCFSIGEPLSCFDYRAWGEGEPSHSKGCVALANPPAKSSPPFWKVIPCRTSLPFICEVSPLSRESPKQRHENRHRT